VRAALAVLLLSVVPIFTPQPPAEYPGDPRECRAATITGYVRGAGNPRTADGTSIWTEEPIAAASYDIPIDSYVEVEGVGTFRVADRGMLSPTHIDVAVMSVGEARALTSVRRVCITRED
jgi:hypothetical protein